MNKTKQKTKVLAVGGGFASTKLALELAGHNQFEVKLITPGDIFEYHGALYRSATGRSPLEVVIRYKEIFEGAKNIEVINDYMTDLRANMKEIRCLSGHTYDYDILALGVGYQVDYFGIENMDKFSETMYSITDTIRLRHRLVSLFKEKSAQDCQIVVVGAGATGIEIASDVKEFATAVATKFSQIPARPTVSILEAGPKILGRMLPEAAAIAEKRLADIGVKVITDCHVKGCSVDKVMTDKGDLPADIIIWTAGSRANYLFTKNPEIFDLDPKGRVIVNEYLMPKSPDIFVMGDAASTMYSGMAQTAIYDGLFVANNLKTSLDPSNWQTYIPKEPAYVIPIGGQWALLQQGQQISSGLEGWKARREADKWVLENFLPYQKANNHWVKAEQYADF